MQKLGNVREFVKKEENQKQRPLKQNDLVELVLGPLADQIDRTRLEILATISKVNESVDIIAQEVARQAGERQ